MIRAILPFLVALAAFGAGFVLLDAGLMQMQGLSLFFQR